MKNKQQITTVILMFALFTLGAQRTIELSNKTVELRNNVTISIDEKTTNSLTLNDKSGGGMAILKNIKFNSNTIN